ncbi:hypothetical protein T05_10409 [Trichinella murrelli]|uniref:Uncharacterized protein n=1 Tax=Trichinella murrelli TaxID=144512 RepID=A0A0V0U1Q6_9BILA|nr:hypothetical protein T05_10409 [Trichinella murrelli]
MKYSSNDHTWGNSSKYSERTVVLRIMCRGHSLFFHKATTIASDCNPSTSDILHKYRLTRLRKVIVALSNEQFAGYRYKALSPQTELNQRHVGYKQRFKVTAMTSFRQCKG